MRKFGYFGLAVLTVGIVLFSMFFIQAQAMPVGDAVLVDSHDGNHINLARDLQGVVHMVYTAEVSGVDQVYYVSNKNGDFSTPVLLGAGVDPVIAVSQGGSIHAAWYQEVDAFSAELWYARSTVSGGFATTSLGEYDALDDVAIAVDSRDIHIVYNARANAYFHGAVQYIHSSGGAFSDPVIISTDYDGGTNGPDVALDEAGTVHIAFAGAIEFAGDDVLAYTDNSSGSFAQPVNVISPAFLSIEEVTLAVSDQGVAEIAYQAFTEIYYSTGTLAGGLSTPEQITDRGTSPCVQVESPDVVHLYYSGAQAMAGSQGIMHTDNGSGAFTGTKRFFDVRNDGTAYGQHWCSWQENFHHFGLRDPLQTGTRYLLFDETIIPATFTELVSITDVGGATQPVVATDTNSHVHVAYMQGHISDTAPDGVAIDIMVTNNTIGAFSEPVTVTVSGGYYSKEPALAVDGSSVEHIVLMRSSDQMAASGSIYYANNSGGLFGDPVLIGIGGNPQIVAHADGKVRITYFGTDDHLYYRDNLSGSFSSAVDLGAATTFGYHSIALDASEHIHIVFLGADNDLYYLDDMSGSLSTPAKIATANEITDSTSNLTLALDSQQNAHIVLRSSSDPDLCYLNNADGDFSTPDCFNGLSSNSFSPGLAIDDMDDLHLVYVGKDNYGNNQMEYILGRDGSFGDPELVLSGNPYGEGRYLAVGPDYWGHFVVTNPINSTTLPNIYLINGFVGDFYRITGYVQDNQGDAIGGATVTIQADGEEDVITTTDASGYFNLGGEAGSFAPGTYTVSVSHAGTEFVRDSEEITIPPHQGVIFAEVPDPSMVENDIMVYLPVLMR